MNKNITKLIVAVALTLAVTLNFGSVAERFEMADASETQAIASSFGSDSAGGGGGC